MNFGETLTKLRKSKGMSQEQLAEELDITRQTISKWELNQSTPDIEYLVKLSDFFEISVDYLVKGEASKEYFLEQKNVAPTESNVNIKIAYKWCALLGMIVMGISLIGIIAFVICSALEPWSASVNNMHFTGLLGFLIATKTLWFFIFLAVLFVLGVIASLYGIVKALKSKNKS